MTDEDRIARLTELARRVYGAQTTVRCLLNAARVEQGEMLLMHVYGAHALRALEGALLALAGAEGIVLANRKP